MAITMTKAEALEIQAKQVAYYADLYPGLAKKVAAQTTADQLQDGQAYDVRTIDKHIPRGWDIEQIVESAHCGMAT
jgi:hypothetical protein